MKKILLLAFAVLVFASLSFGKTITGTVSDSGCGMKHAAPSDAAAGCVEKCVAGGGKYVLVSGGKVYQLDNQDKFKGLGGKSVTVTGAVKGTSITVASVAESKM
jgi:hypothetical protein